MEINKNNNKKKAYVIHPRKRELTRETAQAAESNGIQTKKKKE